MSTQESYKLLVELNCNRYLFREINKHFFNEKSEKCMVGTN